MTKNTCVTNTGYLIGPPIITLLEERLASDSLEAMYRCARTTSLAGKSYYTLIAWNSWLYGRRPIFVFFLSFYFFPFLLVFVFVLFFPFFNLFLLLLFFVMFFLSFRIRGHIYLCMNIFY